MNNGYKYIYNFITELKNEPFENFELVLKRINEYVKDYEFDKAVTVFTVFLNKSLDYLLFNESELDNFDIRVQKDVLDKIQDIKNESSNMFTEYIRYMYFVLMDTFVNYRKDEFSAMKYVAEKMQGIIADLKIINTLTYSDQGQDVVNKKAIFTREFDIQVPYMYLFLYDYITSFEENLISSVEKNLKKYYYDGENFIVTDEQRFLFYHKKDLVRLVLFPYLKNNLNDDNIESLGNFIDWNGGILTHLPSLAVKNNYIPNDKFIPAIQYTVKSKEYVYFYYKYFLPSLEKQIELDEANNKNKQLLQDRTNIIRNFAHSYGNMKATTLEVIANELLSDEDDKKMIERGRKIINEVSIKKDLATTITMLKMAFENDYADIIKKFHESVSTNTENHICYNIYDLFNQSLKRCLMNLLYAGDTDADTIRFLVFREELTSVSEKIEDLQINFEDEVLCENISSVEWADRNNIIKIDSSKILFSDSWNHIMLNNESYAAVFFTNLISELIHNIIRYGNLKKYIKVKFEEDNDNLIVILANTIDKWKKSIYCGAGYGISSSIVLLKKMCETIDSFDEPVIVEKNSEEFSIVIKLNKKLFFSIL